MVFLHGGAFTYSAGSAAIYDGRVLADISRDESDSPTIILTLHYRLGVLGFLASKEIREHNASFGEEGVGDYGIWDQVEALRWVKQHISAFGGDPDRVTLFGQSAGAGEPTSHLTWWPSCLKQSPFTHPSSLHQCPSASRRAIVLSSHHPVRRLPFCGVMSESEYQVVYEKMLHALGIPSSSSP